MPNLSVEYQTMPVPRSVFFDLEPLVFLICFAKYVVMFCICLFQQRTRLCNEQLSFANHRVVMYCMWAQFISFEWHHLPDILVG